MNEHQAEYIRLDKDIDFYNEHVIESASEALCSIRRALVAFAEEEGRTD